MHDYWLTVPCNSLLLKCMGIGQVIEHYELDTHVVTSKSVTSAFCCTRSPFKHFIVGRIKNIVEVRSLRGS